MAKWEGAHPLPIDDAARLSLLGISRSSRGLASSGHLAAPDAQAAAPDGAPLPGGREIALFVIFTFAALLALLASTIWVELRARYR